MIIRMVSFTAQGQKMAEKLCRAWPELLPESRPAEAKLQDWVAESFAMRLPILFIGAAGIAVRSIAPFVQDKLHDSPVLVMDEKGNFIIPLLSGHMGGANDLALEIADRIGAEPVLTTATDVEGLFSVDVFARKNGFRIGNREGIRRVSAKVLKQETITIFVEMSIELLTKDLPANIRLVDEDYPDPDVVIFRGESSRTIKGEPLCLIAKEVILGVGCRKGKSFEEIMALLKEEGPEELEEVCAIASIDLKARERGLQRAAQYLHVPFVTYDAAALQAVEGDFTESAFVAEVTGVSNVCERAAMCAAGPGAQLIKKKTARDGMTLAWARRVPQITSWET